MLSRFNTIMIKIIIFTLFLNISATFSKTQINAVYGEDTRKEIYEISDLLVLNAARATAAMIQTKFINQNDSGEYQISSGVYGKLQNLCLNEKFYNQPAVANCTAFLIEKDLLMTAGHCVKLMPCQSFSFVFDFQMKDQTNANLTFKEDQIYKCQQIERISVENKIDYATIRLNRPVSDRTPLNLRSYADINSTDELFLLGFPSGLPMKADLNIKARSMAENKIFFTAEFDAFGANSGSPVINQKTSEVEGVLVRGEYDFEWDSESNCRRVKKCAVGACKGEEATIVSKSMIYPQNAIAMTNGCSAFLLNSKEPTIVTNGHCVGRIPNGVEWKDKYKEKEFIFQSPVTKEQVVLHSEKILYATMTGTDIAVMNLVEKWDELKKLGLVGLRIYPDHAKSEMEIVRVERYPVFSQYNCFIEKVIPKLTEAQWSWTNAFRHNCDNWGGASGSAIIDKSSGLLIGIHNTANEEGKLCSENNPCEIDDDGKVEAYIGKGYGQRIDILSSFH